MIKIRKKLRKLIKTPSLYFYDYFRKRIEKKGLVPNSIREVSDNRVNALIFELGFSLCKLRIENIWKYVLESNKYIGIKNEKYLIKQKELFRGKNNLFEIDSKKESDLYSLDALILHGYSENKECSDLLLNAIKNGICIIRSEDGFIHSIVRPVDSRYEEQYRFGCSKILDTHAAYFDATKINDLERLLNSDLTLTEKDIERSKKIINDIISNNISKYNNQPDYNGCMTNSKKVLVLDQACNDWSIRKGYASENTFIEMLEAAINENKDSEIYVKVHPDMIQNKNRGGVKNRSYGHYTDFDFSKYDNVKLIAEYCNVISLLKLMDKVYVCTSQAGFEALMCGKETHIFGSPYYAGYGLGIQRRTSQAIKRRIKKRTLEEIFFIAYILYSKYYNPIERKFCSIEEIIDHIKYEKGRFFMTYYNLINSDHKTINVAFAMDIHYVKLTAVSILSLLKNSNVGSYNFYILHDGGIESKKLKNLEMILRNYKNTKNVSFINMGDSFNKAFETRGITKTTYYRLALPEVIEKSVDSIIYCDSDILFKNGLHELADYRLGSYSLAGCLDIGLNSKVLFGKKLKSIDYWGSWFGDYRKKYINAGFAIFNLRKLREKNIAETWRKMSSGKFVHQDQDIINYTCKGDVLILPPKFNILPKYIVSGGYETGLKEGYILQSEYEQIFNNPVAFHYAGKKPWIDKKIPSAEVWWEFYQSVNSELQILG